MDPTTPTTTNWERTRIVAAAQALFLERGVQAVAFADVALSLRLPVATIEHYFPAGKPALVEASLTAYVEDFNRRLAVQRQECNNAVEELLALRRTLREVPEEARSLYMQELAAHYPAQWQQLHGLRTAFTLEYLRANLRRGLAEGLYRAELDPDEQAQHWLAQSVQLVATARTAQAQAEAFGEQLTEFLTNLLTPAGAYVARRLQETPPYY